MQWSWNSEWLDDVVLNELETRMIEKDANIFDAAGHKIVHTKTL